MPPKRKAEAPITISQARTIEHYIDDLYAISRWDKRISFDTQSNPAEAADCLEHNGFFMMNDCVGQDLITKYTQIQMQTTVDLFPEAFEKTNVSKMISDVDLFKFQKHKSTKHGFACIRFGALFQHPAPSEEHPIFKLGPSESDSIKMTQLPWYRNNIQMLSEMKPVTEFLLSAFRGDRDDFPVCAPDSAKIICEAKPELTKPHFDLYPIDRVQIVLNSDDSIKLAFIPRSHTKEFRDTLDRILSIIDDAAGRKRRCLSNSNKEGFVAIPDYPVLINALRRMAIAPPINSIVAWRQRTIHMEIGTFKYNETDLFYRYMDNHTSHQRRIRFFIGLHFYSQDITREDRIRLGLIAKRHGLVPEMYFGENKGSKINPHIVCKKSSQYLKRRQPDPEEKPRLQAYCDESYTEDDLIREIPDPLQRSLITGINYL